MELELATTRDICDELRKRGASFVLIRMDENSFEGMGLGNLTLCNAAKLCNSASEYLLELDDEWKDYDYD